MAHVKIPTAVLQHIADYGYGKVYFDVQENGHWHHTLTIFSLKPEPDEGISIFLDRLQSLLLPGDKIEMAINNGKIGIVTVERQKAKG